MNSLRIVWILAIRNLTSHWVKSLLVGGIMFFGTFLVVTGDALLDSIQRSMEQSITSSLAGQLQVYSADAKDPLSLFGSIGFGSSDIGEIGDFAKIDASLSQVDNVKAVVPMGITIALAYGGNDIDKVLSDLRSAVKADDQAEIPTLVDRVRRILANISKDEETRAEITSDQAKLADDRANIDRATSDEFWASFATDPYGALDFLDTKIAPLSADGRMLYMRTLGTDLDRYTASFDRFQIKRGKMIPSGQRGYLLSDRFYEKFVKNLVFRELDDLKEDRDKGTMIADDTLMQEKVERNAKQYQRILFQLDPTVSADLEAKLRAQLPNSNEQSDLAALLQEYLRVDDSNFDARYKFLYDEVAPHIQLYDVRIGDPITIKAYTKSGYAKSINVIVYGTYEFKGLESSDLAGASNLCDLVTWRDLYGKMSSDQRAELDALKGQIGVKAVSREDAEAALFGGGSPTPVEVAAPSSDAGFDEFAGIQLTDRVQRADDLNSHVYTHDEIESGLALNAAIVLDDPTKIAQSRKDIEAKIAADGLGLQVVDWQSASGLLGQFITVMRIVLYVAIFVIFLVALVIINNAMVMATMERTPEIGTMRAIGARRGFVMVMFLIETVVLGLLAGGSGALAGSLLITLLGNVGLPAGNDILVVLFAGPRLYPSVFASNLIFGFSTILVVSLLSTLYPAFLAARVPPVVAMQGKE
jgi:ABC-type lipoprotein release transport system permease subunit